MPPSDYATPNLAAADDQLKKILGKDFEKARKNITAILKNFADATDEFDKAAAKWKASRTAMEKIFQDLEGANAKRVSGLKQFGSKLSHLDFGLDKDKPDDAKKIKQCQDLLSGAVDKDVKVLADKTKQIDELDKHLNNLSDYDPSK